MTVLMASPRNLEALEDVSTAFGACVAERHLSVHFNSAGADKYSDSDKSCQS
jgi:sialic acid synthase SpsE